MLSACASALRRTLRAVASASMRLLAASSVMRFFSFCPRCPISSSSRRASAI